VPGVIESTAGVGVSPAAAIAVSWFADITSRASELSCARMSSGVSSFPLHAASAETPTEKLEISRNIRRVEVIVGIRF